MTNLIDLKARLAEVLAGIHPKQFHSRLRNFPELLELVNLYTKEYSPSNLSEKLYIVLNQPPVKRPCGKYPLFNTFILGYREFCGLKTICQCARAEHSKFVTVMNQQFSIEKKKEIQKKREETNLKKYGFITPTLNAEVKAKLAQTNLDRYGAETPFHSKIIQEKIKKTCIERHGVESPFQSSVIQKKGQDTTIHRYGGLMTHARAGAYKVYGGINPFAVESVQTKIKETMKTKYGVISPKHIHLTEEQLSTLKNKEKLQEIVTGTSFAVAAIKLGVDPATIARYCKQYEIEYTYSPSESSNEIVIKSILDKHNIKYQFNDRSHIRNILPLELDFFLPDYNIAIEVGSIFNHSEINSGRGKKYHWHKWNECKKKDIMLYQWFDDELKKLPIIENKILYITGKITHSIGARKVSLMPVPVNNERIFLNSNHIQGFSTDRSFSIGGYYNEELVAVMTFANRAEYIELTRYATKLGAVYPGLFSKMFKFMLPLLPSMPIISYSANCHSNGNLYIKNGFVLDHHVAPTFFYTLNYHARISRNVFMKSKLLRQYPRLDSSKTGWELAQELGYDRCWDAGKIAWRYSN